MRCSGARECGEGGEGERERERRVKDGNNQQKKEKRPPRSSTSLFLRFSKRTARCVLEDGKGEKKEEGRECYENEKRELFLFVPHNCSTTSASLNNCFALLLLILFFLVPSLFFSIL